MGWSLVPPMLADDDSGEPLFAAYNAWFLPHARFAVTKSQYMVLKSNVDLLLSGDLTPAQAKLNELSIFTNGWHWVDDPTKNDAARPSRQSELIKAMLMNGDDE